MVKSKAEELFEQISKTEKTPLTLKLLEQAVAGISEIDDPVFVDTILEKTAAIAVDLKQHDIAMHYYGCRVEHKKRMKGHELHNNISEAYWDFAIASYENGSFDQSQKIMEEAIELNGLPADKSAGFYCFLGMVARKQHQDPGKFFAKARELSDEAIRESEKKSLKDGIYLEPLKKQKSLEGYVQNVELLTGHYLQEMQQYWDCKMTIATLEKRRKQLCEEEGAISLLSDEIKQLITSGKAVSQQEMLKEKNDQKHKRNKKLSKDLLQLDSDRKIVEPNLKKLGLALEKTTKQMQEAVDELYEKIAILPQEEIKQKLSENLKCYMKSVYETDSSYESRFLFEKEFIHKERKDSARQNPVLKGDPKKMDMSNPLPIILTHTYCENKHEVGEVLRKYLKMANVQALDTIFKVAAMDVLENDRVAIVRLAENKLGSYKESADSVGYYNGRNSIAIVKHNPDQNKEDLQRFFLDVSYKKERATFVHELTHLVMMRVFKNKANPFSQSDKEGEERWKNIGKDSLRSIADSLKDSALSNDVECLLNKDVVTASKVISKKIREEEIILPRAERQAVSRVLMVFQYYPPESYAAELAVIVPELLSQATLGELSIIGPLVNAYKEEILPALEKHLKTHSIPLQKNEEQSSHIKEEKVPVRIGSKVIVPLQQRGEILTLVAVGCGRG